VSDGVCRQRYNHELYRVYQGPDIVTMIHHRRLSMAGHVVGRDESSSTTGLEKQLSRWEVDSRQTEKLLGRRRESK
jgi:hypothetical protein